MYFYGDFLSFRVIATLHCKELDPIKTTLDMRYYVYAFEAVNKV